MGPMELFAELQQALFEGVVQPVLFAAGMGNLLEDGFVATGWLLVGLLQLAVIVVVFLSINLSISALMNVYNRRVALRGEARR